MQHRWTAIVGLVVGLWSVNGWAATGTVAIQPTREGSEVSGTGTLDRLPSVA